MVRARALPDGRHAGRSRRPAEGGELAAGTLKHWRAFGPSEWGHVADGARGLVVGGLLPVALFYGTLRLWSFPAAVLVVLGWSAAVFAWHRRRTGGADVFSASTFGFAGLQAGVGLLSGDPTTYLAVPSLENLVYGTAFLGSALLGRPILALYARRLYPVPGAVRATAAFRHAFLVVSLGWFVGLGLRAAVRLWLLFNLPLETYLVVNTLAGWSFSLTLVLFTIWYPLRALGRADLIAGRPALEGLEAVEEAAPRAP